MKKVLLFLCAIFFTTGVFATGIGANDTTASCDNDTLGQTSGTSNMEIDWQPNTIDISWYSDNVLLSVQSSAQSCVYDDDLYLPAQPTKTGYTFKGWTVMNIPDGYTRLEYLESTGTQWIDTGIVPTLRYSIEVKAIKAPAQSLFGTYTSYNLTGSGAINYAYWGVNSYDERINLPDTINNSLVHVWGFNANQQQVYCDDIVVNINISNSGTINSLYLFARNHPAYNHDAGAHKIYYAKLFNESNQLVLNYIPARRDSDNVLGMYDTVSGTFFTNDGTGDFIAGPVVH